MVKNEITIKITGEAGQGMKTIGMALCKIFKDAGFSVFANLDYMSRIRGGNNFFQIRVSTEPIEALREKIDILVCLNKESINLHEKGLSKEGVIVVDKEEFSLKELKKNYQDIPFYKIAKDVGGSDIYINSAASGIVSAAAGVDFKFTEETLGEIFNKKSKEIISKNIEVAKRAYIESEKIFQKAKLKNSKPAKLKDQILINGNQAMALGAIHAGCKFYSAYPMTPSTSILTTVAEFADRFNIVVEQAEDEIAAINMAIGASFAGARSMTATSGGGFALMQEGVSLAGVTETPVVIADIQRPAPGTGFPTRTEQADLNFVLYSGHGEFAKVVFTPGTIEECFYLTLKAHNLADKYQIPVFILSDQHLADSIRNIEGFDIDKIKPQKYEISKEESHKVSNYKRYQLTENGISPRAIPSWIEDAIYVDSDEHNEEGHITEDGQVRVKMVKKRLNKKLKLLEKEIKEPVAINLDKAEVVVVGFGSTFGVLKEAVTSIDKKTVGFIHLPQVWPFPKDKFLKLIKNKKKIMTLENNATAQLAGLIRCQAGVGIDKSILKFNGRPFSLDEVVREILKEV